jgi:hypothetical protein
MLTSCDIKIPAAFLVIILAVMIAGKVKGQTTIGVLPVNLSALDSQVLDTQQWQEISMKMQSLLVTQLAGIGPVSKLSREHILLLLKEVPSPDTENLGADDYRIISKKENLHYLLKCTVESIKVADRNVITPVRVVIIDGNNGNVFWEKTWKSARVFSGPSVTGQLLFDQVFVPAIMEISAELKSLRY